MMNNTWAIRALINPIHVPWWSPYIVSIVFDTDNSAEGQLDAEMLSTVGDQKSSAQSNETLEPVIINISFKSTCTRHAHNEWLGCEVKPWYGVT